MSIEFDLNGTAFMLARVAADPDLPAATRAKIDAAVLSISESATRAGALERLVVPEEARTPPPAPLHFATVVDLTERRALRRASNVVRL